MKKTSVPGPYAFKKVYEIAEIIRKDWGSKIYFGAVPYLEAMKQLVSVDQNYGQDSGKSVIAYFLANATTWRGETAREVKAQLNRWIK